MMMVVDIQVPQMLQYQLLQSAGNVNATAVAITTTRGGLFSIERIPNTCRYRIYRSTISYNKGGGGVGAQLLQLN